MKANEKIGILLHQSHCSIVPKNTALLFPNLLHFIFPKSLYFFFLFTSPKLSATSKVKKQTDGMKVIVLTRGVPGDMRKRSKKHGRKKVYREKSAGAIVLRDDTPQEGPNLKE